LEDAPRVIRKVRTVVNWRCLALFREAVASHSYDYYHSEIHGNLSDIPVCQDLPEIQIFM
jgi:hypothetical protein